MPLISISRRADSIGLSIIARLTYNFHLNIGLKRLRQRNPLAQEN